jgi:uncharacterized membrane-anchored protein
MDRSKSNVQLRFHPTRNMLLAEAHARPSTPLKAPAMATRLGTLSGEDGADRDRRHMTALCRQLGQPEPNPQAKWATLDAGTWSLRWERHTEFSTWTFFRGATRSHPFLESALDLVPADWLKAMPGEVLVAVMLELRARESAPSIAGLLSADAVGASLLDGAASVFADLRADANGMTRYLVIEMQPNPELSGRVALRLLEIETYRLMALLGFPTAGETSLRLTGIEATTAEIVGQLAQTAGAKTLEEDRKMLGRLIGLAAEAEASSVSSNFRFAASRAYHEIVHDRIASLAETRVEGLQTLGEFMERRLAPAMRTCDSVAERERAAIEGIARTQHMLDTRVEVEASATSAALLKSMDRRAQMQLRLQRTVEGLSVAAISYYSLGLVDYVMSAAATRWSSINPTLATGISVPFVICAVWLAVHRIRRLVAADD